MIMLYKQGILNCLANVFNLENEKKTNLWQVILSVLAAMVGIQSSKNRERDFTSGNPIAFFIGGIVFTVLFVLTLVMVVRLVVG